MNVPSLTGASARVSEIYQAATSPVTFAALLSQVTSQGTADPLQAAADPSAAATAPASSSSAADLVPSYLFGQLGGTPTGAGGSSTATGAASGPNASIDAAYVAAAGATPGAGTGAAPAGWASALPAAGQPYASAIESAATSAGIDPRLLAAVTWAESGFNPSAVSSAGAEGLTQLMPATAAGLGVDPTNPSANLSGGARYIADQLQSFGNVALAVAAYNAGPGAVRQAGGVPPYAETQAYVARVLGYYQQLGGTV